MRERPTAIARRWNKTPWKNWPRWPDKPPVMYIEKQPVSEPAPSSPASEVKNDVIFYVVGPKDDPVSDLEWELTYPDGKKTTGKLGNDGRVKDAAVPLGTYQLKLKVLWGAKWGSDELEVDRATSLLAHADAFEPGTSGEFEVFDRRGADRELGKQRWKCLTRPWMDS